MSKHTSEVLRAICWFELSASPEMFHLIWGETIGEHFWDRFSNEGGRTMKTLLYMDDNNLSLLSEFLDGKIAASERRKAK